MAALYAAAFPQSRPWAAAEIADLIAAPGGFAVYEGAAGFALGRAIAGEAELLTIAVAPDQRRQGLGQALLRRFEAQARAQKAETAFLEVAEDNRAACALYTGAGYAQSGRRPGYYPRQDAPPIAALLFHKPLIPRESG